MHQRLKGLKFERIQAVEKNTLNLGDSASNSRLGISELSCIASHIKALQRFLRSESEICCILEDDVIFGSDFFRILNSVSEFPEGAFIIKLETYEQKVWHTKHGWQINGSDLKFHKLHSCHYGSAAYLTSRKAAKDLIFELEKFDTAVDVVFFDKMLKNNIYGDALQLNPACCIQENLKDPSQDSDIYKERHEIWLKNKPLLDSDSIVPKNKIIRELKRLNNQFIGSLNILLQFMKANCFPQKYSRIKFKE
jgi:glycosyl transferase family 25